MSSFLHQTTTPALLRMAPRRLYMSSFLHQTTTPPSACRNRCSCICLLSYIKPQPMAADAVTLQAVYVFFPTSNHNHLLPLLHAVPAVYVFFPTSNHNYVTSKVRGIRLYMSSFLHQTTTICCFPTCFPSCICLLSYIKPQPYMLSSASDGCCICLLSYIKPQLKQCFGFLKSAVYVFFPTSNHNSKRGRPRQCAAVYVFFPTSNHNHCCLSEKLKKLYMSSFLHQTTTYVLLVSYNQVLIYFKPHRKW